MHNWLSSIITSPWFAISGYLIGFLGLYFTLAFYFKQKKEKLPVYSSKTFLLIFKNQFTPQKIEILYDNNPIEKLSLTKFAIWNAGKETIRKEDITQKNPLVIKSRDNVEIYEFQIEYSNSTNSFGVARSDQQTIAIDFDYIDFNQGIVINIYHSGNSNNDIYCQGTIIGAKSIRKGIPEEVFNEYIDSLMKPINHLINRPNRLARILGSIIAIPLLIGIFFPLALIMLPIRTLYTQVNKSKSPKRFNLYDN